jgi:hypothetical protein
MTKQRHILFICFLIISSTLIACKSERDPCLQPTTIPLKVGVYQPADTGSLGKDSVLANALWVLADTAYGIQSKGTSKISLSLSSRKDSCRWIIIPDSTKVADPFKRDTLVFHYKRNLHFLSEACGFIYFYTLNNISATNYLIDSIIISNYDVTTEAGKEHVKIFY